MTQTINPATATTPQQRFEAFHAANPHVYAEILRRARMAKAAGVKKVGIRRLWEAMRWDWSMQTDRAAHDFKLNDHYPPFYARLLMREHPEFDGFFEIRERH